MPMDKQVINIKQPDKISDTYQVIKKVIRFTGIDDYRSEF